MLWLLLVSALFFWWATRGNWRARRWGAVFLIGIWLLSTRPIAEGILSPLENRYNVPSIETLRKQGVRQVVVLTGGGFPSREEMLSSAFPHASIYRFLGGMELCARLGPDCRIIFSGSAGRQQRDLATAGYMKDLALLLTPKRRVSAESLSGSTAEHPANVKTLVGKKPFVLVTSAYHIPRSVQTFRKAGLDPIPYPVDFLVKGHYNWNDWLPSTESLWKLQIGFREYLALIFYSIRGHIQ